MMVIYSVEACGDLPLKYGPDSTRNAYPMSQNPHVHKTHRLRPTMCDAERRKDEMYIAKDNRKMQQRLHDNSKLDSDIERYKISCLRNEKIKSSQNRFFGLT